MITRIICCTAITAAIAVLAVCWVAKLIDEAQDSADEGWLPVSNVVVLPGQRRTETLAIVTVREQA